MRRRPFGYVKRADRAKLHKAAEPPLYPSRGDGKPTGNEFSPVLRQGAVAGAVAGLLSGLPSSIHALVTGRDPLAAARAAGNLLLPADSGPTALLAAGGLVHVVVSLGWGTVLSVAVRRTSLPPLALGVAAGAAIAAVDLGLVARSPAGRRWTLIHDLPLAPQVADHLAFGAVAGAVLACRG